MELSTPDYRTFYYAYLAWERSNPDWFKNEKWREGLLESLCTAMPTDLKCAPADGKDHNAFVAAAREAGIFRLYSPTWSTDLPAICAIAGAENYICTSLAGSTSEQETGDGKSEISLQYFDHKGQQAIE